MSSPNARAKRVVVAVAEPERSAFFPANVRALIEEECEPSFTTPVALEDDDAFRGELEGVELVVTSWGFPRIDRHRLGLAPALRHVVHTGASVRFLVSDDLFNAGIVVTQAGDAMAPAVAELSLAQTLALLRRFPRFDHGLRTGAAWESVRASSLRAREIRGARIGVIGASRTGRRYIEACGALGADVVVYDPYLADDDPLLSVSVTLDELLHTADVVALHAPWTPETEGMIGTREIGLMRDGTLLVNTARSALIDMDALYDAVARGRIDAALDVFDEEPLPVSDRWRRLPNALLTPHLGGATAESRRRAGLIVVDEIRRYFGGLPPRHTVDRHRMEISG